ncbi:hypothetical protein M2103_001284 [Ereboglobus sp. PH5-5]|nr:hypothetical protein [Ereboglobus sp. PH5-10]MDF9833067.1 hypothetical protein [Ereboglobus sp. PH5-5]
MKYSDGIFLACPEKHWIIHVKSKNTSAQKPSGKNAPLARTNTISTEESGNNRKIRASNFR